MSKRLAWMHRIAAIEDVGPDADEVKVAASWIQLPSGGRVAIAASRCVFVGVRLGPDEDTDFPEYDGEPAYRDLVRRWLTAPYVVATIAPHVLEDWLHARGPRQYGMAGGTGYDRRLVKAITAHLPPDAETIRVGFDPITEDGLPALIITAAGFRAVIAPVRSGRHTEGAPTLDLPLATEAAS